MTIVYWTLRVRAPAGSAFWRWGLGILSMTLQLKDFLEALTFFAARVTPGTIPKMSMLLYSIESG